MMEMCFLCSMSISYYLQLDEKTSVVWHDPLLYVIEMHKDQDVVINSSILVACAVVLDFCLYLCMFFCADIP